MSLASKVTLKSTPVNSFFIEPTDCHEIHCIIKSLSNSSSPGYDGMNNRLIKSIALYILEPLTAIINLSIAKGVFPEPWKTAIITPIHKEGSRSDPCNYRPISLLSTFSKILERCISKRLIKYLESNKLLADVQFGFRKAKSTEDAVSHLINLVSSHLDKGRACTGVFLDLKKAFDTVSIPILLWIGFKVILQTELNNLKLNLFLVSLNTSLSVSRKGAFLGRLFFSYTSMT
ncbi:unnamed protein product [Colias eurytheme]|nr:unnamed protein product [Colias eurytheme]